MPPIPGEHLYSIAEYQALLAGAHPSAHGPILVRDLPESQLLATVRRLALAHGWLFYHTHRSDRSDEGFPDCTLTKPGRLIFAELKSQRGKGTIAQQRWLLLLRQSVPGIEVYCWRPSDLQAITATLTHARSREDSP